MHRVVTATVAHTIAALCAAATMIGISLELATPVGARYGVWPGALAVLGLAGGLVGALIAARSPRNVLAWLLWVGAAFAAITVLAGAAGAWAVASGEAPAWLPWAGWLSAWTWLPPVLLTIAYVPQIFPGSRPLAGRFWAWSWRGSLAIGAAMLVVTMAAPYAPAFPGVANPVFGGYISSAQFVAIEPAISLGLTVATVVLSAVSIAAVVVRFRRSDRVERGKIWLIVATTILLLIVSNFTDSWWSVVAAAVYLGSFLFSVIRLRLWEIEALIPRAAVGAGIVLVLGTVYLVVVAAIGALFGQSAGSVLAAFTGAVVVGVLFEPLRHRIRRIVDRVFALGRPEVRALGDAISRAARDAVGGRQALEGVAEVLAEGLRTPGLHILLGPASDTRYVAGASNGPPAASADLVPISWQGDEIARVLVPPRRGAVSPRRIDRLAVVELEPTLALIAHDALVGLDLELARQSAVTAREEELRRLRRDLHDGLGPLLAGAALSVEVARDGVARSAIAQPERLTRLLADAAADLKSAISDIRELVYGLRPPALDDLGLVAAVRNLFPEPPFELSVKMWPDDAQLPAAVEVAAYRIAQEALTNVARHAAAHRAGVLFELQQERGVLRIVVDDDGRGYDAGTAAGVGLSSMRERAAELGGRVTITGGHGGGTLVTAVLPVTAGDREPERVT